MTNSKERKAPPESERPPVLYHYTSFEALLSIVKSGSIWATHFEYLNDESELRHFAQVVVEHLQTTRGHYRNRGRLEFIDALEEMVTEPLEDVFVASFSELGDDLTQWRAYCPTGGVSIGFSPAALDTRHALDAAQTEPVEILAKLDKVTYLDAPAVSRMRGEIDISVREFNVLGGNDTPGLGFKVFFFRNWLSMTSSFCKDPAFAAEREWRLVLRRMRKQNAQVPLRFRSARATVIPYIEAALRAPSADRPKVPYFVSEVIVGPNPVMSRPLVAISSLFKSIGHPEVKVFPSQIPFRDW